jgi:hexosaminidase
MFSWHVNPNLLLWRHLLISYQQEIDTPGHTTSIGLSHPNFIACIDEAPWTTFANEPPAGQIRIANPAAVNFTGDMLAAVARTLPSSLFSIGGDEINIPCYTNDSATQQDLLESGKTFDQALSDFVQSNQEALAGIGKTPVVWEGEGPALGFVPL